MKKEEIIKLTEQYNTLVEICKTILETRHVLYSNYIETMFNGNLITAGERQILQNKINELGYANPFEWEEVVLFNGHFGSAELEIPQNGVDIYGFDSRYQTSTVVTVPFYLIEAYTENWDKCMNVIADEIHEAITTPLTKIRETLEKIEENNKIDKKAEKKKEILHLMQEFGINKEDL